MTYKVKLDIFEGPLDLLLYLIKKSEVDIYDIPIAIITEQYLEYMDLMKVLNLDRVGEFLVMASTLIKIKSKMLLPPSEDIEEDEDGWLTKSKNGNFTRRQDCPKVWEYNGAIYVINPESLKEKSLLEFRKIKKYGIQKDD